MLNYFIPTASNNYRAKLLSTPVLVLLAIGIFLFNTVVGVIPADKVHAEISTQDLLTLHNQQRQNAGLRPLTLNTILSSSAQAKAQAMLDSNCWSHYCPNGKSPWDFFVAAGYNYEYAGENLAEGFFNDQDAMVAWMNSSTHRENILKPEYTEVGFGMVVGTYQGKANNIIIVVHFGKPEPGSVAAVTTANIPGTTTINVPVNTSQSTTPGRVIASNTKAEVNSIFLVVLAALFALDFIILSRSGLTRKEFKSHLHFAVFIIIGLIALTGIISGQVGIGLSSIT